MILDQLCNEGLYGGLGGRLDEAFSFLKKILSEGAADGRYELDGDRIFATVSSYPTEDVTARRYEAHHRYIDLQYMVEGRETILWRPVSQLAPAGSYSPEKDIIFFHDADGSSLRMEPGFFVVLYPNDAHKPMVHGDTPGIVKKVVVKIKTA